MVAVLSPKTEIAAGLTLKDGPWIDPTHSAYGAVGDGVTDATAAIQAAANAVKIAHSRLFIPAGKYLISDTITIDNQWGFQLYGAGGPMNQYLASGTYPATVTEFIWAGASDDRPMFLLKDCRYPLFQDFHITSDVPSAGVPRLQCGVESRNSADVAGSMQPMHLEMHRVTMDGTTYGIRRCVRFTSTGGTDTNNDFGLFINSHFSNYLESGVSIEHTQAKQMQFIGCQFNGSDDALYAAKAGVASGYTFAHDGISKGSGTPTYTVSMCSVLWIGGGMHWHTEADFVSGGAGNDGLHVDGLNSEGSARLSYCNGPSNTPTPATFRRVRHSNAGRLHTDGHVVWWRNPGPVTLDSCTIEDDDTSVADLDIRVETSSFTNPASLRLVGNRLDSRGTLPWSTNGVPLMLEISGNKGVHPDTAAVLTWPNVAPWQGTVTKTTTATLTDADPVVLADATSAAFTITLPTAISRAGCTYTIKKIDGTANAVTIDANGTQTIDGSLTAAIVDPYAALTVVSDGSNWFIL